jgi:exopolyphosphatase/guanosine-5'-triphosphate,3'-diphosphate pyrophosphatase
MYLISNGDLKGFSEEEVAIIANIARYHRKSMPKKSHAPFMALSAQAKRVVKIGASLLRLADGLDRSHASAISRASCRVGDKGVKCVLTARSDAELEIWGARRKMDCFEDVFKRKIRFELAKR